MNRGNWASPVSAIAPHSSTARASAPLAALRRALATARRSSVRAGRLATRFNRTFLYAWDLIVWSRIEAMRAGVLSLELPPALLARKGVAHPPPTLRVRAPSDRLAHFEPGFAAVHALLFGNLQNPDLLSPHRHALPGPAFRGVYLWDSAFIAQIWRTWDRAVAVDVLRSVVALRDGDRLQHVVADFVQSELTQPPLIAWSLAEILRDAPAAEARALASEFYPPLFRYHAWLQQHRRLPDGLYAWRHPYESGADNSPRFANRSESRLADTRRTAAPDFTAYVILDAEALAALARHLGLAGDAVLFEAEAAALRATLDARLWHEADGLYLDRELDTAAWKRVRSIASLLPLWAGAGDAARVARLAALATDPRAFGTPIPLPTVALDDPAFEPDMWRGPVWINTAHAVILGLRRQGRLREAAELAFRLCDGVYRVFAAERQIYEFYDPRVAGTAGLHRKRGNLWKRFTLGSGPQREFVGWSGLVNRLVVEILFGFEHAPPPANPTASPAAPVDPSPASSASATVADAGAPRERLVRPAFPPAAAGAVFRLTLPAEGLTIELAVESPDHVAGHVQDAVGLATFTAGFGEAVPLDTLLRAARAAAPSATPPC